MKRGSRVFFFLEGFSGLGDLEGGFLGAGASRLGSERSLRLFVVLIGVNMSRPPDGCSSSSMLYVEILLAR